MKKIIFTKYSNERDDRFKIKTSIIKNENNTLIVEKSPLLEVGKTHITNMYDSYNELSRSYPRDILEINKCELKEDSIQFEFIEGETLEKKLDDLLNIKNFRGIFNLISEYYNVINSVANLKLFEVTEDFIEIFGRVDLPYGLKSSSISNIDIIFSNIIINFKWNLIDYEWTFKFPVPINYTIYRAVYGYARSSAKRSDLPCAELLKFLGIMEEEIVAYDDMERKFERFVIGNSLSIGDIYNKIHGKCINIKDLTEDYINPLEYQVQIFYDYGNGFNEVDSTISYYLLDKDGRISFSFNISDEVKCIRIDPSNCYCIVSIEKLRGYNKGYYDLALSTNGNNVNNKTIVFNNKDPQIIVKQIEDGTSFIDVEIVIKDVPRLLALYLNDSINNKKNEIDKCYLEKIEKLEQQLIEYNETLEKIKELELKIEVLNEKNLNGSNEICKLNKLILEHSEQANYLKIREEEILKQESIIKSMEEEILKQKSIIKFKEEEMLKQQQFIFELESSSSWKITKPFRYIGRVIRRIIK